MKSDASVAALFPEPPPTKREALGALAILTALTFALHWRALQGYFLVDDWINMRWLEEPGQLWRLFIGNWMFGERVGDAAAGGHLYRPIPRLSFLFDRWVWGLERPWGFHLTNLILHSLNVFFVWGIAWSLWRRRVCAWAAALLFWAHPLTLEPVQWISARTDLWAAVFAFPAIWMVLEATRSQPGAAAPHGVLQWGALVLVQLGFLAKETSIVLPAVLLAIDALRRREWGRERALWWAAVMGLWALHFAQRRWMFGEFLGHGIGDRFANATAYVTIPLRAGAYFLNPWIDGAMAVMLCGTLFAILMIAVVVWTVRRQFVEASVPLVWFVLSMAPLIPLGFSLSENTRLLYPATAALCVLFSSTIMAWKWSSSRLASLLFVVHFNLAAWILVATTHYLSRDYQNGGRAARRIVEMISNDIAAQRPEGSVVIAQPPSRWGRAAIFGTVDVRYAVEMVLNERGAAHAIILSELEASSDIGASHALHYAFSVELDDSQSVDWGQLLRPEVQITTMRNRVQIGEFTFSPSPAEWESRWGLKNGMPP